MDAFDPVLVERLYHEPDIVFCSIGVAHFREPVKMLDNEAAERIIVF